jgi:outer membrane protein
VNIYSASREFGSLVFAALFSANLYSPAKEVQPPANPATPYVTSSGRIGGIPDEARQIYGQEDSRTLTGKVWTLPDLINEALMRNPSTRSAWESANASAADLGTAKANYYPTVTLSGYVSGAYSRTPTFPGATTTKSGSLTPEVDVSWTVFDFGATKASVEKARFTLLASNFSFNNTLQSVALTVLTDYYSLDQAKANVANAEEALRYARVNLESVQQQLNAGLTTSTALLQAQQTVAQDEYTLVSNRGTQHTAEVALAVAVGLPGGTPLKVASPGEPPDMDRLEANIQKLVDLAIKQRPDIANYYSTYMADAASARQAHANRFPTFKFSFTGSRSFEQVHSSPGSGGSGYSDSVTAGLTVSYTLFDGGSLRDKELSAAHTAAAAKETLANAELTASNEVAAYYYGYKTALSEYKYAKVLVESSKKSYDSVLVSYRAGLSTILDLLTAQSNLASAKYTFIQARTAVFTNSVELASATGSMLKPGKATR